MKHIIFIVVLVFMFSEISAQQNIYINQVGYITNSPKQVYTDYEADSFAVVNVVTKLMVFKGEFNLKIKNDIATGLTLYQGDFSNLTQPGKYLIKIYSKVNSGITSYPFAISDTVFSEMINLANKSLYLQRCGLKMKTEHVGIYAREECHLDFAEYHPTAKPKGKKDMTGGWHDAGDYGKYVAPGSVTIATMLFDYDLNSEKYTSDARNIPESGNGVPDVLDEIKYELDWMFKMQREDGAVHEKIHTKDYVQFIMPSVGDVPQYIYEVSSTATADFAAIMAKSSRSFKSIDANFSEKCLNAAVKSYEYLSKNLEVFPVGGFKNPEDTKAGGYSDAFDKDERIWAAAELFITTGKANYHNDFKKLYSELEGKFSEAAWNNPSIFAYYSYLLNKRKEIDEEIKFQLKKNLLTHCDEHIAIASRDGFGVAMHSDDYVWGSNGYVLTKAMNHLIAFELSGDEKYRSLAISHLNYILGVNVHKISFVTGVGTNRILHLHHAPTVSDFNAEPIPGILSGGPNKYRNDDALQNIFDENTPAAKVFLDNEESYASNENTIYTNAALVFVANYLNQ